MDHVEVTDLEEWRAWLDQHHDQSPGAWLVTFRKGRGPYVGPYEANNEALRYGWFDQHQAPVDDLRVKHLYRPRRPFLPWSSRDRFETDKAVELGRMTTVGLKRAEEAKADGSWCSADLARIGRLPLDLTEALDGRPDLRDTFDLLDPKSKNGLLWRLKHATGRTPGLRSKHIHELLQALGALVVDGRWWNAAEIQGLDRHINLKVSRRLLDEFEAVHLRAGTLIVTGPPGLSKSWSADEFVRRHPHTIGRAKLPAYSNVSWLDTQRQILTAVRGLGATRPDFSQGTTHQAASFLLSSALNAAFVRAGGTFPLQAVSGGAVSIVIDDAQRLSASAISNLLARDRTLSRCLPFGLILVGDASLSQRIDVETRAGASTTVVTLTQDDLIAEDIGVFLTGVGLRDADAQAVIVDHLNQRGQWSLRRAQQIAERTISLAGPAEPGVDHVRQTLRLL